MLVALAAIFVPRAVRAVTDPIDDANAYLRLIKADEAASAYELLCQESRSQFDLAAYEATLQSAAESNGELLSFNVFASHVEMGGDAFVAYDVRTTKGRLKRQARLVNEQGEWHWCGAQPR